MTLSALEITRKAIIYRANHRGTKEADHVIGGFIRTHLAAFSDAQIPALKTLIDFDDVTFFQQVESPDADFVVLTEAFKAYKAGL